MFLAWAIHPNQMPGMGIRSGRNQLFTKAFCYCAGTQLVLSSTLIQTYTLETYSSHLPGNQVLIFRCFSLSIFKQCNNFQLATSKTVTSWGRAGDVPGAMQVSRWDTWRLNQPGAKNFQLPSKHNNHITWGYPPPNNSEIIIYIFIFFYEGTPINFHFPLLVGYENSDVYQCWISALRRKTKKIHC